VVASIHRCRRCSLLVVVVGGRLVVVVVVTSHGGASGVGCCLCHVCQSLVGRLYLTLNIY
jgi:hypothetical protein